MKAKELYDSFSNHSNAKEFEIEDIKFAYTLKNLHNPIMISLKLRTIDQIKNAKIEDLSEEFIKSALYLDQIAHVEMLKCMAEILKKNMHVIRHWIDNKCIDISDYDLVYKSPDLVDEKYRKKN